MKKLLLIMLFPILSHAQLLELYTGAVDSRAKDLNVGTTIGGNLYLDLFQTQRQGKQQRIYANRAIVGFEHSNMSSNELTVVYKPYEGCGCDDELSTTDALKHKVRGISLNAGIEIYNGWYLLSGITSYEHKITINNESYSNNRTMYIDAGLQKVIPYNRWYFIPKIKFNHETTTFGIGVSYK